MESMKHLVLLVQTNGEIFDKEMSHRIEVEHILDKLIAKNQDNNYILIITIDWKGNARIQKVSKLIDFVVIETSNIDNLILEIKDTSIDTSLIHELFEKYEIEKNSYLDDASFEYQNKLFDDLYEKLDRLKSDCVANLLSRYDNDTKKLMRIFNADSIYDSFKPHIESWLDYHTTITLKDFEAQEIDFISEVSDQLYSEIATKNIEL